jgi:DNA replication protein DnaC
MFLGTPGVGKTDLVIAIGIILAIEHKYSASINDF